MSTEREELEKAKAWISKVNVAELIEDRYPEYKDCKMIFDKDILFLFRSENPTLTDKEDNNGWYKISIDGFPTEEGKYLCIQEDSYRREEYWHNNNIMPKMWEDMTYTHYRKLEKYPDPKF